MASHGVFIRGWSDPFNRRNKRGQEDAPQLTVIKQAWDANPKPFAMIHLKGLLDSWELSAFAASAVTLGRARAAKVKIWAQEGRLVTGPSHTIVTAALGWRAGLYHWTTSGIPRSSHGQENNPPSMSLEPLYKTVERWF